MSADIWRLLDKCWALLFYISFHILSKFISYGNNAKEEKHNKVAEVNKHVLFLSESATLSFTVSLIRVCQLNKTVQLLSLSCH